MWPVLEPGRQFKDNWHVHAIADHLEACSVGHIKSLVINIPPRCMKSLLVSVFWHTWEWTWNPVTRWLCCAYGADLAVRDNLKARRIIRSKPYQTLWGHVYKLTGDQNAKLRFENSRAGYRLGVGVSGGATGEGGDRITIDDPHKAIEADSEASRKQVQLFHDETMSTRGNDADAVFVLIMQRLHENDLTGHVLAQQYGYEHLMLPMEFESKRRCFTSIGFRDPRTKEGELLWPARFTPEVLKALKRKLGPYGTAGQLQQLPSPRGGGKFKREWFKFADQPVLNKFIQRSAVYIDKAGTEGGGDYTAMVHMTLDRQNMVYVEHVVRGQWGDFEREKKIREFIAAANRRRPGTKSYVEKEGGSGGKFSAKMTIRANAGQSVQADDPGGRGSKDVRAGPYAAYCEAGDVVLVKGGWNEDYLKELEVFPNGAHDDQVDASSGAFYKLVDTNVMRFLDDLDNGTAFD